MDGFIRKIDVTNEKQLIHKRMDGSSINGWIDEKWMDR